MNNQLVYAENGNQRMDVDTISKNGRSSKSQMSRGNKKWMLVFLAVVLTAGYAHAQFNLGARVGWGGTDFLGDIETDNVKIGIHFGVVGEYAFSNKLSVQPSVLFATQGYQNGSMFDDVMLRLNVNYIQIPVNVNITIKDWDEKGKLLLQAGPYFGYALSGKFKVKAKKEKEKEKIEIGSNGYIKSSDFGLGLGAALRADNSQVGLGINIGLANISPNSSYNMKNFGFWVNWIYFFGK